eukprot:TRINITY_DN3412_c0_g1_i5.p1 TRINITY_DN3412_c0_g1~~TRINITY_DN3412_c0_g1_i5.p1  ORF type:complete len:432 (-),score=132.86 TRINITY_DN3412_c0_g1_i5:76-1371(-)
MEANRAAKRVNVLSHHLNSGSDRTLVIRDTASSLGTAGKKAPDDIVIVKSLRTAIGKARRGSFKDSSPDQLLAPLLKHILVTTPQVKPEEIGDFIVGTVLPRGGQGATEVRVASLLGGLPESVPCSTVNRQCSSGLQAIANAASAIRAGYYDVAIAGGVESMSLNPMAWDGKMNEDALQHERAMGCYMPMGQTSENVAQRFKISRDTQDKFAVLSNERAVAAIKAGRFKDEIVPITVKIEDPKTNEVKEVTVSTDEGPRASTLADLTKLRPAFSSEGTTTAGNASQLSDGAALALVTSRAFAEKRGLPILGVLRSFTAVGVEPSIMGIGPAVAIPAAVKQAGLALKDIDLFEINEAFASQATYCVDQLGISIDKVNVNGGAIALGHPLGCTGARLTATLLHELTKRKARYGVVSMCIGSGMGAAAVYEVEQ